MDKELQHMLTSAGFGPKVRGHISATVREAQAEAQEWDEMEEWVKERRARSRAIDQAMAIRAEMLKERRKGGK